MNNSLLTMQQTFVQREIESIELMVSNGQWESAIDKMMMVKEFCNTLQQQDRFQSPDTHSHGHHWLAAELEGIDNNLSILNNL